MANPKLTLGLDIGSTSIKLVQLKEVVQRGVVGYQLQAFGIKPLPPEAIIDGALMNLTAIVQAIQELVAELNIKNKNVTLAIPGHSVIIKKISLPVMSQEELDESIQTEAGQYINIDIKDVYLDTYPLPSEDDQMGQMDVMLVAAKKDMVNDYAAVVSEAGLNPVIVDIDTFAIQNCFEANYEVASGETVVLLNVGASIININILTNGVPAFTRDITVGGNHFTEEIQKQLNVSYEEAEMFKSGGADSDSDAIVPQEVESILEATAEQIAGEIQRSIDFYTSTIASDHIGRIFVSGGSAKVPALFKAIEQRAGLSVEILNPFRCIEIHNRRFDPAYIMDLAPVAAVAVGLGLRRLNDKELG